MTRTRRHRAAAQLLGHPSGLGIAGVVRHLLAVQAQDARSARLALRARIAGLRRTDVDGCEELAVTWLMRGTLHLVHSDDLPWLHALTAPARKAPNAARLRALGVSDDAARRAVRLIRDIVDAAPATRAQLGAALADAGLPVAGQVLPHLLARAALEGLVVRDLVGNYRPVGLPDVAPASARLDLARRYAVAHPGATRRDLAAWSGLPLRDLPDPPADVSERDREPATALPPRLLGPFDPYLLDWRDRTFAVSGPLSARVAPGGGAFRATCVLDGRVVGTWRAPGGVVTVEDGADPAVFAGEAADVERFLAS